MSKRTSIHVYYYSGAVLGYVAKKVICFASSTYDVALIKIQLCFKTRRLAHLQIISYDANKRIVCPVVFVSFIERLLHSLTHFEHKVASFHCV